MTDQPKDAALPLSAEEEADLRARYAMASSGAVWVDDNRRLLATLDAARAATPAPAPDLAGLLAREHEWLRGPAHGPEGRAWRDCDVCEALRRGVTVGRTDGLSFAEFASINRSRCESPDGFGHPVSGWSLSDWMLAATGEFGEAANVAKKLNRVRDGIPGNTQTPDELHAALADEFADAVIYLDLAAQSQGIDLGAAIVSKFNRTSERIGAPHRLLARLASPSPEAQP